jgi:hypothetical protein
MTKHLVALLASLPAFAQHPAPATFSNLAPRFNQEVVKTVQLTCQDVRSASCYSEFILAADGGNRYDSRGNLYLPAGSATGTAQGIQAMDPNGNFSRVATLDGAALQCADSASGAVYTGKSLAGFSYNPGVNALYAVTTSTVIQHQGTCVTPGPMVNMLQTIALIRMR